MIKTLEYAAVLACLCCHAWGQAQQGRISSVTGAIETSAGNPSLWKTVADNALVPGNTRIRSNDNASCVVTLFGTTTIYLNQKSQIKIEFSKDSASALRSQTITVYYGEIFLSCDMPENRRCRYTVATPSASMTIDQGAGFSVLSDTTNATTRLMVLRGVVDAKVIGADKRLFVQAPTKAFIDRRAFADRPEPMDSLDLMDLSWTQPLNPLLLSNEQNQQATWKNRIKATLADTSESAIVVCRLKNSAGYTGAWDIEQAFAALLADKIRELTPTPVEISPLYGTETELAAFNGKALQVVSGKIVDFELARYTPPKGSAKEYGAYFHCKITLLLSVDAPAHPGDGAKFKAAKEMLAKDTPGNSLDEIIAMRFSLADPAFSESAMGKTLRSVLSSFEFQVKNHLPL
ncbi:MAG: hypothetical protein A2268_13360 [Candidatus Raymondbacteria bacterium RifOxyA12_full_50_37]|uniref:FecR protein domain-containing protein n=1 Tax=Candidatus Raymondbacteria bacterium RIFOXYD12_FULL_49_13 TaxID=1817890 RepID=A0A1F7EZZ0_UNCRA|nr:MAG: hypothetical protein A2268_13360 [Candidatus Raymondbacteria bacterium RifOxyA12_full_50_37]OGJ93048.1 MAG: hypothetical protein A2248_18495 [Candidatus Raymondbacteria bacterium RIFOXYA2_FULL_49_16]OGJ94880.1 MAG: hypothetical protein A2350_15545 [Candidatus Raymondbacteria bacterium RifOxyB12_full_50_8]OGJ99960.1 MAG: hypothetical protein A2519_00475 [Candidatus Raymondbacteria bacterium RIFOXYD12_FULL_49_13]OGK04152.1 MAG: hypothetical protein A2487_14155 [Candidatus Raymondbacteria 